MASFLLENAGSATLTAIFLWAAHSLWTFFTTSDDGSMDDATEAYLKAKNTVSPIETPSFPDDIIA